MLRFLIEKFIQGKQQILEDLSLQEIKLSNIHILKRYFKLTSNQTKASQTKSNQIQTSMVLSKISKIAKGALQLRSKVSNLAPALLNVKTFEELPEPPK